ncbi:4-hydroxythreonine-4-phosphate dehydrogenase PdxA [Roseivirga sp.]|uniref:4-hydroxythreonine-4-phosphate dehydrogenase PdxA n=1 Tax=Roseivirga sp. TaxID=1964215 RepID=UPI003B523185
MQENKNEKPFIPTLGITIGDMNGIGPEVIIKSVMNPKIFDLVNLVVYGHGKVLSHYKNLLGVDKFSFNQTNNAGQIRYNRLNVINCVEDIEVNPGEETKEAGALALAAIQKATEDLKEGKIDAIVTAPINKNNIQSDDFKFPGHTEYFTEAFGAHESLMFLCGERIRIGVATGHISIAQIKDRLNADVIRKKLELMLKSLKKDFNIGKPKIAVLGLNPHAGEDGLLGNEEIEIIQPVINEFKEKGELVFGPYPADGFFGNSSQSKFDGILAMYHDQGLIPFKTLAFEEGVNFTAGLSAVRTSPDHGTAYNIAGKGIANEQSMRSAIYMAKDVLLARRENTH